jgi:hypothetical protein
MSKTKKCIYCNRLIKKNEPRIRRWFEFLVNIYSGEYKQYHWHPWCFNLDKSISKYMLDYDPKIKREKEIEEAKQKYMRLKNE